MKCCVDGAKGETAAQMDRVLGASAGSDAQKLISALPVHADSAQWLSHMSTSRALHPDFGGPYGIPVTTVTSAHPKVTVSFDKPHPDQAPLQGPVESSGRELEAPEPERPELGVAD